MNIHDVLDQLSQMDGSDIHIVAGSPLTLRVNGNLMPMEGSPTLEPQHCEALIYPLLEVAPPVSTGVTYLIAVRKNVLGNSRLLKKTEPTA